MLDAILIESTIKEAQATHETYLPLTTPPLTRYSLNCLTLHFQKMSSTTAPLPTYTHVNETDKIHVPDTVLDVLDPQKTYRKTGYKNYNGMNWTNCTNLHTVAVIIARTYRSLLVCRTIIDSDDCIGRAIEDAKAITSWPKDFNISEGVAYTLLTMVRYEKTGASQPGSSS